MKSQPLIDAVMSPVTDGVVIHSLSATHLEEIAAIHRAAFPLSLLTELGSAAVKNYCRWQMQTPHGAAVLGARKDGRLLGYCFLTYAHLGPRYVRHNWMFLLLQILKRPQILLRGRFWTRRALELLFSGWSPAPAPRELRILAIAVDPRLQGQGIGKSLADAAERVALASDYRRMGLSVHPENTKAVAFYDRNGWRRITRNGGWRGEMYKELTGALSDREIRESFRFEADQIRGEFVRRDLEISAARYDPLHVFNQHALHQVDDALRRGMRTLGGSPISRFRVLDLGCGSGSALLRLAAWGADPALCHGIDLDAARIELARRRLPAADFQVGDAVTLPWPDATFDLILQSTVFTSILANCVRRRVAGEMLRTLKPGGAIVWHDLRVNNPANPRVRGIGIAEVRRLFPNCRVQLQRTLIAPPVGRRLYESFPLLVHLLEKFPFLCTHLSGLIVRDPGASC
jgi:ubiquinone/menaquinone biosynthesis C-methylase UbiE/GNAT superfamily N-acetyltransferase